MKLIFASAVLLCASITAAQAESFTFEATATITNAVMLTSGPAPYGATMSKGTSQVTYASGKKATNNFTCAAWTTPPGVTNQNGACLFSESAEDTASIASACAVDAKTNMADCWGQLRGISGRYKGKTGTISWHGTISADQKTGKSVGTGMWND